MLGDYLCMLVLFYYDTFCYSDLQEIFGRWYNLWENFSTLPKNPDEDLKNWKGFYLCYFIQQKVFKYVGAMT